MGSHYGVKIRKKVNAVKAQKKDKYDCPQCGKKNLRRAGNSLWVCASCNYTMAGGAYTPSTLSGVSARKTISSRKA